ncbi:Hpt domain-containing protein [Hugenholtzia roseola]|uniref:Hpt domain-containing protein n=1 Tax=Hugenholtzia roseola TaxID=1002 RepID=UPI0003F6370A|nr:Hpt domain-containing protein [Hugenholtzia roseola]
MPDISTLPIVNLDTAQQLQAYGGKEILNEVYTEFETETQQILSDLEVGIAKKDWEWVRRSFHTIKGSSATLGIERMQRLAYIGETNQREGKNAQAPQDLKALQTAFEEYRKVYKQILRL